MKAFTVRRTTLRAMNVTAAMSMDGSKRLEDTLRKAAFSSEQEQRLLEKEAKELINAAARLQTEANDAAEKVKRLRDEADKMTTQSKRLCTAARDACSTKETLVLEATCLALRRNDEPPNSNELSTREFPPGYATVLGPALQQNTHVLTLNICLETLIPNAKDGDSPMGETDVKTCVAPLVQYVETSPSLRSVLVDSCHGDDVTNGTLTESILGACFCNPSLENLTVEMDFIPAIAFGPQNLAPQASCSLTHLRIKCEDCYAVHEQQAIAVAFQSFSSLTSLDLDIFDCDLMTAILVQLAQCGHDKIDNLSLSLEYEHCKPQLWPAIAAIVHANPDFRRLHLAHMSVFAHTIEAFINVLKRPKGDNVDDGHDASAASSPTSMRELSLRVCTMHGNAGERLCRFLHTKVEPGTASSLQKLTLDLLGFDCSIKTWVSMLCLQKQGRNEVPARLGVAATEQQSVWYPTIGSQITSLRLEGVSATYNGFLEHLAKKAHRVRLETLTVSMLERRDAVALAKCISKIKSLRALDASWVKTPYPIVCQLRDHAGSIHSACVTRFGSGDGDITTKLAKAYGERNQHLDPLLRQTVESVVSDSGEKAASQECAKNKSFCLPLLQASTQIPSTTSATVLRSLLRLRETLGDDP